MKWFLKALRQYADFSGRARRKEFWLFSLFYYIFSLLVMGVDYFLGIKLNLYPGFILTILYFLATLIPSLSVTVRRLHDVGKSGWMILVSFIPLIGSIWLLVLFLTDSNPGENKYGPNPKEEIV